MKGQTQVVVELPIEQFSPSEYYCRASMGLDDFLLKSIERHGQLMPMLVNLYTGRENVIIDGVARWEAMWQLGYKTVQVTFVDVSQEEEIQQHIISNQQCRQFYEEFIRKYANGPLTDALLEHYSQKDKTDKSDLAGSKKITPSADSGSNEVTPLNIHLTRDLADWVMAQKKKLQLANRSQVIEFLIQNYINNEKNRIEQTK